MEASRPGGLPRPPDDREFVPDDFPGGQWSVPGGRNILEGNSGMLPDHH
jgi:hypothetical protein